LKPRIFNLKLFLAMANKRDIPGDNAKWFTL
jgi:hypothetical protein